MRLKKGDLFKVTGCRALKDLEEGREYRVDYVSHVQGDPFYGLRHNRGRKIVAKYPCNFIDPMIGRQGENKIDLI